MFRRSSAEGSLLPSSAIRMPPDARAAPDRLAHRPKRPRRPRIGTGRQRLVPLPTANMGPVVNLRRSQHVGAGCREGALDPYLNPTSALSRRRRSHTQIRITVPFHPARQLSRADIATSPISKLPGREAGWSYPLASGVPLRNDDRATLSGMAGPSSAMMTGQATIKCGGSQSLQSLRRQPLYLGNDFELASFCIISGNLRCI